MLKFWTNENEGYSFLIGRSKEIRPVAIHLPGIFRLALVDQSKTEATRSRFNLNNRQGSTPVLTIFITTLLHD